MPSVARLDENALIRFGERVGKALTAPAVIYLNGELGTGKTTLARAISRGWGAATRATSPTYALAHEYTGPRGTLYHVDCYRLRTSAEAEELALDVLSEQGCLLIEWPARAGPWAPPASQIFTLRHTDDPSLRVLEAA